MKFELIYESLLQAEMSAFFSFFPLLWDVSKSSRAFTEVTESVAQRSLWGSTNSRAKSLTLEQVSYGEMKILVAAVFLPFFFFFPILHHLLYNSSNEGLAAWSYYSLRQNLSLRVPRVEQSVTDFSYRQLL